MGNHTIIIEHLVIQFVITKEIILQQLNWNIKEKDGHGVTATLRKFTPSRLPKPHVSGGSHHLVLASWKNFRKFFELFHL